VRRQKEIPKGRVPSICILDPDGDIINRKIPIYKGATWTTDAHYRETNSAIQQAKDRGILAVEMEASSLLLKPVIRK